MPELALFFFFTLADNKAALSSWHDHTHTQKKTLVTILDVKQMLTEEIMGIGRLM